MAKRELKVEIISMTPDALKVIFSASRQCYSASFAGDVFRESKDKEKMADFIRKIIASGHESPLEHVNITFAIEGISRVCSHQLVRHRIASYSQQSQRYVKEDSFDYVIPPLFKNIPELEDIFENTMQNIQLAYNKIVAYFKNEGKSGENVNQDVRFLLPGACETKIVVTMNVRELTHFFKLRICTRTQWELRRLAQKMLELCRNNLPAIFQNVDAKCKSLGYCSEGEKFSCGRYPVKQG